ASAEGRELGTGLHCDVGGVAWDHKYSPSLERATMPGDFDKLFAGHMDISTVILNVLIDKGVISQDELLERFQQARDAESQCSGGPETAAALAEVVRYLDPKTRA